jgi:hypothetical protein
MTDPKEILRRLREDFAYYAPRCLKIRTKSGAILPFELNRAQEYIHSRLEAQLAKTGKVRALILKGRQQGASTYIGGRFYWKTSGEFGKQTFILTHEQNATDNLFSMTKRYHENCPAAVKPSAAADNAKELFFDKLDSRYKVATAGAKATGRSATAQYFHGSEAAFWPNAADHMAGIGQTVPDMPGTEIILESTAYGIGNLFHTMWQSAEAEEGEYIAIFCPWFWEGGYRKEVQEGFTLDDGELAYMEAFGLDLEQMAWRRTKIVDDFGGDIGLFNQEYPATAAMAFQAGSQDSLISSESVQLARNTTIRKEDELGPLIIGVDPAEYGDDKTAITPRRGRKVYPVTRLAKKGTMEQVGIVAMMIEELDPDAVCIDVTGVGTGVADRLIEMGYKNIYRIHAGAKAIEDQKYVNKRAEMWGLMREWLNDSPCDLPDDDALQSDLTGLTYSYDSSRRMVLESKEKAKKRGLRSPDSADSLALTFAVRVAPRNVKRMSWRDKLNKRAGQGGSAQAA